MQQEAVRIPPVAPEAFTSEQKALVGDWATLNFSRVIVEHPDLYRVLMPMISKVITGSKLPPRDREVLILRTLSASNEIYEYNHHVTIARKAGLSDAEIEAVSVGAAELPPLDGALVRAADELMREQRIADRTWRELAERYSSMQLMDVVAVVGVYVLMAMLTKSFGIQLESDETFNAFGGLRTYT